MKNLFSKLMFLALTAITFTACNDVPDPYDIPGTGSNVPGVIEIPGGTGEGTFESPFNAIAALNFGNTLEAGQVSKNYMYIKGLVSKIEDKEKFENNSYGNATFYISEDGSHGNEFYVYRVNYLGNKKFASGDTPVKLGDEVIICAKITNYNGTIETNQNEGFVYELNGVNRGGEILPSEDEGEAKGDGSLENPFNAVAANAEAAKLGDKETSANSYYIKGKVAKIAYNYGEGKYPASADYYISDDGKNGNTFYVYGSKYLGNTSYTSGQVLAVGDEVIIYGQLYNYQGTYETATNKSYLYSLNGVTKIDDIPEPSGENLLKNGDFETWTNGTPDHWKTASTAGNATVEQSNDAHDGSYSVSVGFNTSTTKRLAYEEITLKAGTYTFSFYAKSTTTDASQTQAGYVDVVNGTANSYKYGGYVSLTNTAWTLVSTTFTLAAQTTVCLVMMNPKTTDYATAQNILVDDASLVTSDGGIIDGEGGDDPDPQPSGEAQGDGTLENPFNAVAATNECKKLASGAVSSQAYYIKGKVSKIDTDRNGNVQNFDFGSYGNATFYISDDGTTDNQFYCYRVLYLGNKKWVSGAGDILKVGDEVIVYAKLTMYNTTPETKQGEAYLYSLNGVTE